MKIDLQTLKELELLETDAHGLSVFELLNLTTTSGGEYKLKQNFRRPFDSIKEIEDTQEGIKYILSDLKNWQLPVDGKLMDLLDVYFFSKSKPSISKNVVGRFFENISYRFHYKDYKETFILGPKYILSFLKKVSIFYNEHAGGKLPVLLADIFSQINEMLELQPINEALKLKSVKTVSSVQLLYFDKIFRETNKDEILKLFDLLFDLDVLISKARACDKHDLSFPEYIENNEAYFEIEELYHLFLKKPVVNTIDFVDSKNFIFLTGPNMAGKTTFLKACGVAIFLSHIGMGVPAKSMKLSLFDQLFTSLNVSDNLPKGYSYFYSEVKRVKEAAKALQNSKKAFVVFDELFKGTNVKDAFDGSLLIIKELVKWQASFFILSSHLLELGKEIQEFEQVRFMCFDSRVENGKPFFNFKVKEGLSDERLGLVILKNEEVFKMLDPENEDVGK
jgi:DNA mismatch repair protein MutS